MSDVITKEIQELEDRGEEIAEELDLFPDHQELFHHIINIGRKYPALPDEYRTEDRLLPGCISQLWIQGDIQDGKVHFYMDADAMISKGLAALLLNFYNGKHPEAVIRAEPAFLNKSGLLKMVSGNRSNSLVYLRDYTKNFAAQALSV
ncbi:MAG: SufE family protein [Opitutales bacterium]|nr:SufE family protein [Opitutales bacterium]MCH8540189.1 SufE family protein [Opitutales bacterium]